MKSLRIGLFTECYRPIQNGVVASVDALGGALRARGHTVICVTPHMPGYVEECSDVVRIPSLPLPIRTAYRLTLPMLAGERVARALGRIALVHTHSPFVTGWMGARVAKRAGLPLVFTYHTQLEEYAHYVPFERRATRSAAAQLTRSYANMADAVIVPTAAMQRRLREIGVQARIEIVPTGIDVPRFAAGRRSRDVRAGFGVSDEAKMVLSVGRLGREKNLELALQAFARLNLSEARFVVVGDGAHREALEREAARLGVAGRTTFAGEFPRAALPDIYASADAFLLTSHSETQGLVLVEALAAGVPIVAVDTPATRDVLRAAGRIVAGDPDALAAALSTVLGREAGEAGLRAPGTEAHRFGEDAMAALTLSLYESLIGSGAPRSSQVTVASA